MGKALFNICSENAIHYTFQKMSVSWSVTVKNSLIIHEKFISSCFLNNGILEKLTNVDYQKSLALSVLDR